MASRPGTRVFWPLLLVVLLADCTTKSVAVEALSPPGEPHSVVGDVFRLTLVFNDRGAMGLPVGDGGRRALGVIGLLISGGLFFWYRRAGRGDRWIAVTSALLIAGAVGNAWQRIWSERGVVDFIDIGLGAHRFWTFNVADVALTAAAGMLFWIIARDPAAPESS
ncbi:signal peptidase II [Gaopeijia maritima]|uniref:Lipoprotein signal peptidase n=1 Tax=Gaopeijia maritima TaxID=3119007 RepID=A0ABU9E8H5_9BACT